MLLTEDIVTALASQARAGASGDLALFLAPVTDVTGGVTTMTVNGADMTSVVIAGLVLAIGDTAVVLRQGSQHVAVAKLAASGGEVLHYSINGTLTVKTGPMRAVLPRAGTVTAVHAEVGTAPTGADLVIDLLAGETVVATVTVPAGDKAASAATITSPTIAAGATLAVDVTAIGSTVAGKDLCLSVVWA